MTLLINRVGDDFLLPRDIYENEKSISLNGDYDTLPAVNRVCRNCINSIGIYVKSVVKKIKYKEFNTYYIESDKVFCSVCYGDTQLILRKIPIRAVKKNVYEYLYNVSNQKQQLFKTIYKYPYLFPHITSPINLLYHRNSLKMFISSINGDSATLHNYLNFIDKTTTYIYIKKVLNRKIKNSSVIKNYIMMFLYGDLTNPKYYFDNYLS